MISNSTSHGKKSLLEANARNVERKREIERETLTSQLTVVDHEGDGLLTEDILVVVVIRGGVELRSTSGRMTTIHVILLLSFSIDFN